MEDESHSRDNQDRSPLSDGESTPNSIGVWLVIAIAVSVVMVLSNRGGAIASLLFLFGPIILIILAIGKATDWATSHRVFDKLGSETQPLLNGGQQRGSRSAETQDRAQQDRPK